VGVKARKKERRKNHNAVYTKPTGRRVTPAAGGPSFRALPLGTCPVFLGRRHRTVTRGVSGEGAGGGSIPHVAGPPFIG
jgi:hypothetical protein